MEVFSPTANAFNKNDDAVLEHLSETVLAAVNRATQVVPLRSDKPQPEDATDVLNETSSWARLHRAILVAAAATLAFALLWLLIPHARVQPASANARAPKKLLLPSLLLPTPHPPTCRD